MKTVTIFGNDKYHYRIIQIPEKKAEEHFNKARLFAVQAKYKKAAREYEKALEIEPTYKKAQVNLDFLRWWSGPLKKIKD